MEGMGQSLPPIKGFAADIESTLCMKCSEHMAARHLIVKIIARPSPGFFTVSMSRVSSSSFSASTLHLARGGSATSTGLTWLGLTGTRLLSDVYLASGGEQTKET
ncbi:hypothetical protein FVEG_16087 [Fusarium verticillioides 7600]|uniref:Uncharacterized protein n=1 Tax=Gibberella moniliformis (strain M3125 / FGSC 7600) TaxID=334819 RepID=W7M898_GIBM7|nr:hypothetical protein FVEG_16087 [Fusarium verticillioides 7600]EWG47221.1 hypothetical protein FVEG_16087 [Fusarium verticillioides 7600]